MDNQSILNQGLENITGFESQEIITDFRPILIPRNRWSDLEYTSSLEIQYFTYYVVLIEHHRCKRAEIAVVKHEVFHPNKDILVDNYIGNDSSCSPWGSNVTDFQNEINKFIIANDGAILNGALISRLNQLVSKDTWIKDIKQLEEFTLKYIKEYLWIKDIKQLEEFTLKSIHDEFFNYFRFGQKILWYEDFIHAQNEKKVKDNERRLINEKYDVFDSIIEEQDDNSLYYQDEQGKWYYAGDYPEENIPD